MLTVILAWLTRSFFAWIITFCKKTMGQIGDRYLIICLIQAFIQSRNLRLLCNRIWYILISFEGCLLIDRLLIRVFILITNDLLLFRFFLSQSILLYTINISMNLLNFFRILISTALIILESLGKWFFTYSLLLSLLFVDH